MGRADFGSDGLRVAIGLPSAVLLVIGGMVGVGIFVNPAVVARGLHSPALVLTAWIAGGLITLLGAVVYAELAARIPHTGGEYAYLREAFGPMAGFLFGWTSLLVVRAGGMAAVAIIFARNMDVLLGGAAPAPVLVIGALALLALTNCLGVRTGNGVQAALGAVRLAALGAIIVAGLCLAPHGAAAKPLAATLQSDVLKAFGAAMIPVVFSFGGWQTASAVAGEVINPRRNLALALIVGVAAVITLYLLVNLACLRALGIEALGKTLTPASDVLQQTVGPLGARLAAVAIALSAFVFLSQGMLTAPRVLFAMSRDGLFLRGAGRIGASSRAPTIAIILQASWTGVLALSGSYEQILSYVTAMNFLFFSLCAAGLFVLRRRDVAQPAADGFRGPGHPWIAAAFIVACLIIIGFSFWTHPINSLIGYGILVLGVPPYLYWRRKAALEAAPA